VAAWLLAALVRACEPGLSGSWPFRASGSPERPPELALRYAAALRNYDVIAHHVGEEPSPIVRALLLESIAQMDYLPQRTKSLARFLLTEKDPRVREAGARALRPRGEPLP
jgi:hypothetical protein